MNHIKTRLNVMMLLQYGVWGLWLPVLATYLQSPVADGGLVDSWAGRLYRGGLCAIHRRTVRRPLFFDGEVSCCLTGSGWDRKNRYRLSRYVCGLAHPGHHIQRPLYADAFLDEFHGVCASG